MKIRTDDEVIVISGKDKGKTGKVIRVDRARGKVFVEGLNMVKRHTRPTQTDPQGGIRNKEAALHISNVAFVDPKSGEPTRVGFRMEGDKKVRFAKKSGEVING